MTRRVMGILWLSNLVFCCTIGRLEEGGLLAIKEIASNNCVNCWKQLGKDNTVLLCYYFWETPRYIDSKVPGPDCYRSGATLGTLKFYNTFVNMISEGSLSAYHV